MIGMKELTAHSGEWAGLWTIPARDEVMPRCWPQRFAVTGKGVIIRATAGSGHWRRNILVYAFPSMQGRQRIKDRIEDRLELRGARRRTGQQPLLQGFRQRSPPE